MNQATIWLVARRELATRVRTRAFILGTGAIILVAVAYAGFMTMVVGNSSDSTVGFTGQATTVAESVQQATSRQGSPVDVRDIPDRAEGERMVRDGDLEALVTGAPDALTMVVKQNTDPGLRATLDTIAQQQALDAELAKNGLSPAEVHASVAGAQVKIATLESADPDSGQRLIMALAAGIMLYMFLIMGGQAVAQGVVEEKSSRVVELLLSTIRPAQLVTGKVLGIGLTTLLQFAIIAGVVGGAAAASGALTLPSTALIGMLGWAVVWFLLGFFFYSTILAAVASLVSRMEDLQSVISPVIMALIVPFVIGTTTLPNDPENTLGTVLSFVPGFSPMLMPMRTALGVAAPWEIALSIALSLLAGLGLLRLGGRIYANAVLHTGARVKLSDALRSH